MALNTNIKMENRDSEMMPDAHNFSLEETANALQTVKVCRSPNPMDGLIFSPLLSNDIKKETTTDLSLGEEHYIHVDQKEPEEFQKPFDLEMTPEQLESSFNIQPPLHAYTGKFKKSTKTKKSSKKIGTRQRKVDSSKTDLRNKNSKNIHHKHSSAKEMTQTSKISKEMTLTSKKHQCELCNVIFPQKKMLVKHKKLHKKIKKTFPCKVCKESFSNIISLLKHSQIHSNEKNCNVCSKSFNDAATLRAHKKTHVGEKPFKCDVCSKSFFNVTRLKSHGKSHLSRQLIECDVCRKSFRNNMNLIYHMATHKTKDKNLETDPTKLDSIDDKAHDIVDGASTSSMPLKPMTETTPKYSTVCVICNRSFKSCQSLKIHMRSHENDRQKPASIEDKPDDKSTVVILKAQTFRKTPSKTPFKCDVCNKSLKSCQGLKIHMRSHENDRQKPASIEDKPDDKSTVVILKPQTGRKTPSKTLFKCDVCNKSLKTKMALRFHSKTHKILNKSLEREPFKTDRNGDNSDDHEVGAVDTQDEEDTCANFDDTDRDVDGAVDSGGEDTNFNDSGGDVDGGMDIEGEAEDNREDATDITGGDVGGGMDNSGEADDNREDATDITDKDEIECVVSFQPFACLENQEIHRKRHSSKKNLTGNPAPFMCVVCGKNLSSKDSLQTHSRIHTGEKPFVCDICSTAFSDKGALTKHSVTHSRERNHYCEICGRGFGLAGQLTRHMSVHSGEKPFKCKVCDRAYKRKSECNLHYRKHHCDLEVKVCKGRFEVDRAECSLCQSLVKKNYMKEHMKIHRQMVRSFTCDVCPLSFARRATLVRHMKTHTGEKPFKCDREGCEMAYKAKSDLYRHIRNFHEKFRPFTCDVCKKDFFDKTRLDFHSSEHTGKYRYTCNNCGKKFNYRSRYHRHLARTLKCKRKPEQRNTQKSDPVRQRRFKRGRSTCTKNEQSTTANSDVTNSQKSDSMEQKKLKRAGFTKNGQSTQADSMGQKILIRASNFSEQFSLFAGSRNKRPSTQTKSGVANSQKPESVAKPLSVSHQFLVKPASPKQPNPNVEQNTNNTLDDRDLSKNNEVIEKNKSSDVANYQKPELVVKPLSVSHTFLVTPASPKQPNPNVEQNTNNTLDDRDLSKINEVIEKNKSSDVANYQKPELVAKPLSVSHTFLVTPASPKQPNPNVEQNTNNTLDDRDLSKNKEVIEKNKSSENSDLPETSKLPASESMDVEESLPHRIDLGYKTSKLPASESADVEESLPHRINLGYKTPKLPASESTDVEKSLPHRINPEYKTSNLPAPESTDVQESLPHRINLGYKSSKLPAPESTDVEKSLPHRINPGYKTLKLPASESTDVEKSLPHGINLGYKCDVCNDRFHSSKDLHIHIIMHLKANMSPRVDARGIAQVKEKTPGPVADINSQEEKYRQWLNQRENPLFDEPKLKASPSAVVVENGLSMLSYFGAAECSDAESDYDGLPANDVKEQDGHTLEKSVHTEVEELKNQGTSGQQPVNNGNKAMEVKVEIEAEELDNADERHIHSKAESVAAPFFEDGDSDDSMVINVSSILPKNIF